MDRREVLKFGAGLSAALLLAKQMLTPASAAGEGTGVLAEFAPDGWAPFSEDNLLEIARKLSQAPFSAPEDTIPPSYKSLDYDQFRAIRFNKSLALWSFKPLALRAKFSVRIYLPDARAA